MDNLEYRAASEIILPPGSTSADLQTAVDSAVSGDMIIISGDMPFADAVTIPTGKEIRIQSNDGNSWVMYQPNTNIRHFSVTGILILENITLDGMHNGTANGGGGINVNGGSLAANEGTVIKNCYTSGNGGAVDLSDGTFTINGGAICSNTANNGGGGICLTNSDVTILDGTISDNTAYSSGGGVYFMTDSTLVMTGGIISGNTTNSSGGGLYVMTSSSLIVYEGVISGNTGNYGGGIYMSNSSLDMNLGLVSGNAAIYGGGIFVRNSAYNDIKTSVNTIFNCNRAEIAHEPPADAGILYPDIKFASTTITSHPLNNYDINYTEGSVINAAFHITYYSNGGTGSHTGPDIEPCDMDTVLPLEDTDISRRGYTFTAWNTVPDGSGDSYGPDDEITVSGDIALYAQWKANLYTVAYNANGGNGSYTQSIAYDTLYTVLSAKETGISRMMYILTGWNTQPDGTGTSYTAGDTFVISGEAVLYAQWKKITRDDAVNLILASIAMEELAAAHILNEEGKKLQCVLGTLDGKEPGKITIYDILAANNSIQKTLREVIKTEMLLLLKMEDTAKLDAMDNE